MIRRTFLATGIAALALANPGSAASFADSIVAQLRRQGFVKISSETTWLGRVRIVATRFDGVREIIVNPRTGEILRDLWTTAEGQTAYSLVDPVGSKGAPAAGEAGQPATFGGGSNVADGAEEAPEPQTEDPAESSSGDDPAGQ